MKGLKDLEKLNIKYSEKPEAVIKNEYKGNVTGVVHSTDHVAERFYERYLNYTNYSFDMMKSYIEDLISNKGIIGYKNQDKKEEYIAIPRYGLLIIKGNVAVTFIDVNTLTGKNLDLYIKLLKKGRVK